MACGEPKFCTNCIATLQPQYYAAQNQSNSGGTDVQQLKQAIALLNRWMDDPEQDMLLSDTDRFVRDSATACV